MPPQKRLRVDTSAAGDDALATSPARSRSGSGSPTAQQQQQTPRKNKKIATPSHSPYKTPHFNGEDNAAVAAGGVSPVLSRRSASPVVAQLDVEPPSPLSSSSSPTKNKKMKKDAASSQKSHSHNTPTMSSSPVQNKNSNKKNHIHQGKQSTTHNEEDNDDDDDLAAAAKDNYNDDLIPMEAESRAEAADYAALLESSVLFNSGPIRGSASLDQNAHHELPMVMLSKVIAPDCSGVRCVAVHPNESELVVARENGSLMRLTLQYFQNVPHFAVARHTGGRRRRTVTSVHYWCPGGSTATPTISASASSASAAEVGRAFVVATYLSGQVVVYDSDELFPVYVHQRTGGAIWSGFIPAGADRLLTAVADGSWHQLRLVYSNSSGSSSGGSDAMSSPSVAPARRSKKMVQMELERVVPRIPGADRALSVHASLAAGLAAGTDDAGNVIAWRLDFGTEEQQRLHAGSTSALGRHETVWTARVPKGMGLCCCICSGGGIGRAVVAVGTTAGEVVLLDAAQGHLCSLFSQHKGPVSSIIASADQLALYATGWHESLRCYRCDSGLSSSASASGSTATSFAGVVTTAGHRDGADLAEWVPAQVKRRTHYHEATQLLTLPQSQLLLSASRDGTIMYAPMHQLFSAPANYLSLSTQQFAFATERNVLLHTRYGRIEAFYPDSAGRHWCPLFAYAAHGSYHLSGLWCDAVLSTIVFATDERAVVVALNWADPGLARRLRRIEQRAAVNAGRGVLDVIFASSSAAATPAAHFPGLSDKEEGVETMQDGNAAPTLVYLLRDDGIVQLSTDAAAPQGLTPFPLTEGDHHHRRRRRVERLFWKSSAHQELIASGLDGCWIFTVSVDGTLNADSARFLSHKAYQHTRQVPMIGAAAGGAHGEETANENNTGTASPTGAPTSPSAFAALSTAAKRYLFGSGLWEPSSDRSSSTTTVTNKKTKKAALEGSALPLGGVDDGAEGGLWRLPATLPHDTVIVAQFHPSTFDQFIELFANSNNAAEQNHSTTPTRKSRRDNNNNSSSATDGSEQKMSFLLLGYFSRGLLLITDHQWKMVYRGSVEAAFIMSGKDASRRVVILERNLEKALESMPLCWKVKRFGN